MNSNSILAQELERIVNELLQEDPHLLGQALTSAFFQTMMRLLASTGRPFDRTLTVYCPDVVTIVLYPPTVAPPPETTGREEVKH